MRHFYPLQNLFTGQFNAQCDSPTISVKVDFLCILQWESSLTTSPLDYHVFQHVQPLFSALGWIHVCANLFENSIQQVAFCVLKTAPTHRLSLLWCSRQKNFSFPKFVFIKNIKRVEFGNITSKCVFLHDFPEKVILRTETVLNFQQYNYWMGIFCRVIYLWPRFEEIDTLGPPRSPLS